jgi:hypothetical protein
MARIQILELPTEEVGDVSVTPFAIILDQLDYADLGTDDIKILGAQLAKFARECGARTSLATEHTIEVPGLTAEEIATINRPLTDGIRELVETVKPRDFGVHIDDAPEPNARTQEAARRARDIVRRQP